MNLLAGQGKYYLYYFFLLLLVLIDRAAILQEFTFQYVDDDQSIMWIAAKEFASGNLHEPCFYGQPYNTQFESLCAVPLIWCGISYAVALTVTMSLITLLPYVLLSYLLLRKGKYIPALTMLGILLLLPVEFGMITAISRGLMTGILFAGIAIIPLFADFRYKFLVFGFFGVLALYANPSAIILLFPVGLYLVAENFRSRSFYLHTIVGAIPAAAIWILSLRFYSVHPEYVAHGYNSLEFSLSSIKPYVWDRAFNYVTPVLWNLGWFIIPILLTIGITLIVQKEKRKGYALLAGAVLVFFVFGFHKVNYGFPTVFLSWARMFTAIPLLIAVFLSQVKFNAKPERYSVILLGVCLVFFAVKLKLNDDVVHREIEEKTEHAMYVSDIDTLKTLCDTISTVANKNNVELIVIGNRPEKHLLNYACPCMNEQYPVAIEPELDRRTWLLDAEDELIRPNILFVGFFSDLVPQQLVTHPNAKVVSWEPYMLLLENNSVRTDSLLSSVGLPMRTH